MIILTIILLYYNPSENSQKTSYPSSSHLLLLHHNPSPISVAIGPSLERGHLQARHVCWNNDVDGDVAAVKSLCWNNIKLIEFGFARPLRPADNESKYLVKNLVMNVFCRSIVNDELNDKSIHKTSFGLDSSNGGKEREFDFSDSMSRDI